MPDCIGSTPRARCITNAAPMRPNTAPDAPTVTSLGESRRAPNEPAEQRREVEREEARVPERRLEHLPQPPEDVHVEADVDQAGVQEAAGDEPPVVVPEVDRRAPQREVVEHARVRRRR